MWKLLCEIPYGQVTTYGALARRLADEMGRESMSAQAVGGAVGHNPISIIVPCHRVVNAEGRTAPGWEEQRARLEAEGVPFRRNGRADLARAAWEVLREPAG